jgi:serine/threonine-protein phosphatase PGAM5
VRVLHFMRHGQYLLSGEGGRGLTALGRRQARAAARELAGYPIAAVHSSDLARAVETSDIIAEALGHGAVKRTRLLRELLPGGVPGMRISRARRTRGRENLDAILARYFRRARGERHELVVCHGNLIRGLVCRALDGRSTAWLRMDIHHCGITRFAVRPDGSVRLLAFNEIAHLPPSFRTQQ